MKKRMKCIKVHHTVSSRLHFRQGRFQPLLKPLNKAQHIKIYTKSQYVVDQNAYDTPFAIEPLMFPQSSGK